MAQSVVDEIVKTDDAKAKGLVTENGVVKLVTNTGTIEAKDIKIDAGSKGSSEISRKIKFKFKYFKWWNNRGYRKRY